MIACGFEVCAANPRVRGLRSKSSDPMFACAILGLLRQNSDSRFAQQNPRMVRIRTLRLTYILTFSLQHRIMHVPLTCMAIPMKLWISCTHCMYVQSVTNPNICENEIKHSLKQIGSVKSNDTLLLLIYFLRRSIL